MALLTHPFSEFHRAARRPAWHGFHARGRFAPRPPCKVSCWRESLFWRPRPWVPALRSVSACNPPVPTHSRPNGAVDVETATRSAASDNPVFRCSRPVPPSVFQGTVGRRRNSGYPTLLPACPSATSRATLAAWVCHGPWQSLGTPGLSASCRRSELASLLAVLAWAARPCDKRPRSRELSLKTSAGASARLGVSLVQSPADRSTSTLPASRICPRIARVVGFR